MKQTTKTLILCLTATLVVSGVKAQTPDFGSEEVVSEETTWVFNGYSNGDLAAWDNANSTYPVTNKLYARRYSSRKFTISALDAPETVSFSDGYTISVSKIASSSSSNTTYTDITTANSTGGKNDSNGYPNMTAYFAFNASVAGTCYVLLKETGTPNNNFRGRIHFWDGTTLKNMASSNVPTGTDAGSLYEIKYNVNAAGSYFIGATSNSFSIYAIRFVPSDVKKTVYIGATGYATFGNNTGSHLYIPSGLTAYAAKPGTNSVTLTALEGIPQTAGVVLKGETNTNYSFKASATTYSVENNYMKRVTDDATLAQTEGDPVNHWNYILADDGGTPKFFLVDGTSTIAKDKAYLNSNKDLTAAGSRGVSIIFADEATGIEAVTTQQGDGQWYNLQGQKVAQPAKGLFIKNGKKVIIK
jgi:hypothetical protein